MKSSTRGRIAASFPRLTAIALVGLVGVTALVAGCRDGDRPAAPTAPQLTQGSGSQSTLIGRATFAEGVKARRQTGDWVVEVSSRNALDVAVQSITFQPGGHSGWHKHPGPVFIQVVSGTMTFYEADDPACTPIVRTAGQGYLDAGEHGHIARNETDAPAQNVVTYLAPPGAALRIDMPEVPEHCRFRF